MLENIVLQNPTALFLVPLVWLIFLILAGRRRFKPFGAFLLRLLILVLLVLALSQPTHVPPPVAAETEQIAERLVILVDQSASLGDVGQQALRTEAARLAATSEESYTLFFADQTTLVDGPQYLTNFQNLTGRDTTEQLNPEITDLAGALVAGAELLTDATGGRLVLLSDGLPTTDDNLLTVAESLNVPVDVLLPSEDDLANWRGSSTNEVYISRIRVPPILREGETFDVEVVIYSEAEVEVTLNLTQNETVLAEDVVLLEAGTNLFTFETTVETIGPQTFRAVIAAAETDDAQTANNRLAAFARVYPPPEILVIGEDVVHASLLTALLDQAGFAAEILLPERVPTNLAELEPYAGMILLDVSARALTLEQMVAIQEFGRSLGRGVLITGGRNSLSLGNYEDTPLAEIIPLTLEAPPRSERPPVALLLIIDHSGSMIERRGEFATKLAMAKEAAIRATDILGPDDLIGILMFDNQYDWVVPFQPVSDGADLLNIQQQIALIPAGGGTRILQALEVGLPALAEEPVPGGSKHAVLLTDGRSFDGDNAEETYRVLLSDSVEAKITLSTIAIGTGADQELLSTLAEQGKGRYHFAATPDELPALTIAESDILRSNSLQEIIEGEEPFRASPATPHSMTRGLFTGSISQQRETIPTFQGYLALKPKPLAEIPLQTGPGDPLLAVWGYGLGRVAVWTSDTGQEWATDWLLWDEASRFWGQIIGYLLPSPELGLLQLEAQLEPDNTVTLIANSVTATGQTVDLAPTEAILVSPNGRETALRLRQVAPGQYQQSVRLPDTGVYQLRVSQTRPEDGVTEQAAIGFVAPYPAEYALPPAGTGQRLLQGLADITEGRTFALNQPVTGDSPRRQTSAVEATDATELWPYFLLAALLLWPAEIAWRRWGRLRIQ